MTAAEAIATAKKLAASRLVTLSGEMVFRMIGMDEVCAVLLSATEAHAEGAYWFISGTDTFGDPVTLQVSPDAA